MESIKPISKRSDDSNGKDDYYMMSSVERSHPWREVFKNISSIRFVTSNDGTRDFDDDYEEMDDLNNMMMMNGRLSMVTIK
ncbi:MAG: hypothetical protein ACLRZ2_03210 [Veillonella sp.]